MAQRQQPSMPGSVSAELLNLVTGTHPEFRWVRGGMFATAIAAGFVAPYLGWQEYR